MHKKYCLVFVVLFLVSSSIAQNKNDNMIIVHGYVSYNQIRDTLAAEGFTLINSDTTLMSTNFKAMGLSAAAYATPAAAYLIKRTDTSTVFKGYVRNSVAVLPGVDITAHSWPLKNYGEKKSVFRVGFALMGKIASSFGLPVTYLKEETK